LKSDANQGINSNKWQYKKTIKMKKILQRVSGLIEKELEFLDELQGPPELETCRPSLGRKERANPSCPQECSHDYP
jgi:hypothetical protein